MQVSSSIRRVTEGVCSPIPPTEWLAWITLSGEIVYPWEHRILTAMDVAFCAELNKELDAQRSTQQDETLKQSRQGRRR